MRDKYNSISGVRDIGSGLKKFLEYIQSDYKKKLDDSILHEEHEILTDNSIDSTEKESIIKSRIGQGVFRQNLIDYWKGCSVTECKTTCLLVASHIRPWRKSDNKQRLDVFNGLLLIPNFDKLFDRGYISFDDNGKIICSVFLSEHDRKIFGIRQSMHLKHVGKIFKVSQRNVLTMKILCYDFHAIINVLEDIFCLFSIFIITNSIQVII